MEYKYAVVIKLYRKPTPDYEVVAEADGSDMASAIVEHLKTKEKVSLIYVVNKERHSVAWSTAREGGGWKSRYGYNSSAHTVAETALAVSAAFGLWINTGGCFRAAD